ncbi:GHKL domain-containing protein [Paenibacillus tritici]|uniref:histidine kinase n=1 Tax=Paenibacillus tritici TaxID=1873425 RepID=A0ABX2DNU4_9BACL|nr:ATP-binding protein [Paenibacillus tritici]NQX45299.1 GHKL domain-containing protein [Paenibacillus tritici]QUL56195.1 GHKL domain-containing protein [Paenibacillus tritici]
MISQYQESLLLPARTFQSGAMDTTFEDVLEHIDSGILLFDDEGVLTFVNKQMYGILELTRHSLLGCTMHHLLSHIQLSRFKKKQVLRSYREMVLKGKPSYEFVDEYGRYWRASLVSGEQMKGSYLFTLKEISDYKLIEQTAYQNDSLAMLGRLSASIAHEIRNPLTAIRGFIQLLHPHLHLLGKEEYAKIILAEIDRANDIIHEFLTSSKPSVPQVGLIPVSALLKEVVLLTESEALMKGCQINLQVLQEDLFISGDVKQMKQVVLNMIRNAMEAISELEDDSMGRIEVGARKEGTEVRIFISDNGKGMDICTLDRLFNPFFTTKENGTGLGLSVSDRIIKNHGGCISVSSQLNEGTRFVISLPLIH